VRVERVGYIASGSSTARPPVSFGSSLVTPSAAWSRPTVIPVHPVARNHFRLTMAQCIDILIDLPRTGAFRILARLEGDGRQTGIVLATLGRHIPPIDDRPQTAPRGDRAEAVASTCEGGPPLVAPGERLRPIRDRFSRTAAPDFLVVATGARRRAAELGIASSAQRGRTVCIAVGIAVIRMQHHHRPSVHVIAPATRLMTNRLRKRERAGESECKA
jgi:hypothetical protein